MMEDPEPMTTQDESSLSSQQQNNNNNDPSSNSNILQNEREVVRSAGRAAISSFLDSHTCFSVLRASGKVVVFDTRIPIQLAFYALVEHDMQAAPLWDPSYCQFVGLLTVTDFIDILRHYRLTRGDVSQLASRSIADILSEETILNSVLIRNKSLIGSSSSGSSGGNLNNKGDNNNNDDNKNNNNKGMVSPQHTGFLAADTSTTLKHACRLLHLHSLDFLPIIMPEDMRVLATVTYTNILEHLVTHFREQRRLFDDTIYDLGIGTYHDNLITINPTQTLSDALDLLHQHGLSALPVVDVTTNKIIGVYSRSDITFLASASDAEDAISSMDLTLDAVMAQRRTDVTTPDALHTCTKGHTLQSIFEYFAQLRFNRLFVVDDNECCVGVVSARDLVAYFLEE